MEDDIADIDKFIENIEKSIKIKSNKNSVSKKIFPFEENTHKRKLEENPFLFKKDNFQQGNFFQEISKNKSKIKFK